MNDILTIWLGFLAIFLITFILIAFIQGGFFWKYLIVRASRGKKILCKIRGSTRDYYQVGKPKGAILEVKIAGIKVNTIVFDKECIYNAINVKCIDIDEQTMNIMSRDYSEAISYDHPTLNNIMKRILTAPSMQDKLLIILIVVCCLTLLVCIAMYFKFSGDIKGLKAVIESSVAVATQTL